MTQEYEVRASLNGAPELSIAQLPYLSGYRGRGPSFLMFSVQASLPIQGEVRYRIRDALNVSTKFRVVVRMSLAGQLGIQKAGDTLSLKSPELHELHVDLHRLDLSNDLVRLGREPIEHLINHELRVNDQRIREKANQALHKAVEAREFRGPLIRFLPLGK